MRVRVRRRSTTSRLTDSVPYAVDRRDGNTWVLWALYATESEALDAGKALESLTIRESAVLYDSDWSDNESFD